MTGTGTRKGGFGRSFVKGNTNRGRKKRTPTSAKIPFERTEKPELLKYDFAGCWSKRITDEHRLVYKVETQWIEIIACRYHY